MDHRSDIPGVPERPLVLLVDADDEVRRTCAEGLREAGFEVVTLATSARAFSLAWAAHPDVIVTELVLPTYDGWDLLRELKRDPRTRDIPVLVVTAEAQPGVKQRVQDAGGAAYLPKPCPAEAVALQLFRVLASEDGSALL